MVKSADAEENDDSAGVAPTLVGLAAVIPSFDPDIALSADPGTARKAIPPQLPRCAKSEEAGKQTPSGWLSCSHLLATVTTNCAEGSGCVDRGCEYTPAEGSETYCPGAV